MVVWIVMKTINHEIVDVFDDEEAAKTCKKNIIKQWCPCIIIEKEIKSL